MVLLDPVDRSLTRRPGVMSKHRIMLFKPCGSTAVRNMVTLQASMYQEAVLHFCHSFDLPLCPPASTQCLRCGAVLPPPSHPSGVLRLQPLEVMAWYLVGMCFFVFRGVLY